MEMKRGYTDKYGKLRDASPVAARPPGRRSTRWWLALCAVLLAPACAQVPPAAEESYKPTPGQVGKDVVWVPSPPAVVERMLDIARVTRDDFVMDLGSGDGRNVIAAGRRGARAVGVEFNPDLVGLSSRNAARQGVADRATFVEGDMYAADISRATVLALFLLPDNLRRLLPKFLDMKPGTRIVVNYFGIDGWRPDYEEEMKADCEPWCVIKLYVVPARVAGKWRMGEGELELTQQFQEVFGTYTVRGAKTDIANARMEGDRIRFAIGGVHYTGRVLGDRMEGESGDGAGGAWTARK